MTDPFDHRHVVADEQDRNPKFGLQFHNQVKHLRLHRHVQRADTASSAMISFGFSAKRARNRDPLTLSARQFMRDNGCRKLRGSSTRSNSCATRSARSPALPMTIVQQAARPPDRPASSAGSATRTGPETPSACRAAPRRNSSARKSITFLPSSQTSPDNGSTSRKIDRPQRRLAAPGFAHKA